MTKRKYSIIHNEQNNRIDERGRINISLYLWLSDEDRNSMPIINLNKKDVLQLVNRTDLNKPYSLMDQSFEFIPAEVDGLDRILKAVVTSAIEEGLIDLREIAA